MRYVARAYHGVGAGAVFHHDGLSELLRQALRDSSLRVVFQPIVSLHGEEEKQFLISELRAPLDLAALVADVPNEMVAAEVYAASLLAIDLDTQEEVAYLRQLAQALRLDGATVARLHQITGATPV